MYLQVTYIGSTKYKSKANFKHLHNTKILYLNRRRLKCVTRTNKRWYVAQIEQSTRIVYSFTYLFLSSCKN